LHSCRGFELCNWAKSQDLSPVLCWACILNWVVFSLWLLQEVEPMAMECDHIQITALSQALNIALQVEYVDEMDTALNHHVFPEAATPSVYLLYKTSHYNILYAADKH
jgi:hypothetical protein